jgi:hypothetical protein
VSVRFKPRTVPSLLRLAAIQYFERVKDSAGLAPKCRFIAAETVERDIGPISETQKATRELNGRIDGTEVGRASAEFVMSCNARFQLTESAPSEQCIDDLAGSRENLAGLPKSPQTVDRIARHGLFDVTGLTKSRGCDHNALFSRYTILDHISAGSIGWGSVMGLDAGTVLKAAPRWFR